MSEIINKISKIINEAQNVLVLQADNPDADSLASSLALEQILEEMGKNVQLYCAVDMPSYLKYLQGWDRVSNEFAEVFDASIIVDASTMTLFEHMEQDKRKVKQIASKPVIVLDHHETVENEMPFENVLLNDPEKSSTGELIFMLATKLSWPVDKVSAEFLMTAILGDTQGLSNELTSSDTYRVMAKLVDSGADRPKLEEQRKELSKMSQEILKYKARLIERTKFKLDGKLALTVIPHEEIIKYSPIYNPNALIQGEHLQTENVRISIALKSYNDGKITASIRCSSDTPFAAEIAEKFGGGGHKYASGFKVITSKPVDDVIIEVISAAAQLFEIRPNE